jgi:uncharacterized small protein (DUF1192 family)
MKEYALETMKCFALALAIVVCGCYCMALAQVEKPEPPKAVKPDPLVVKYEEAQKENAELKSNLSKVATQANGLLAKVGELSQVNALLELEVKRLSAELEAARKDK